MISSRTSASPQDKSCTDCSFKTPVAKKAVFHVPQCTCTRPRSPHRARFALRKHEAAPQTFDSCDLFQLSFPHGVQPVLRADLRFQARHRAAHQIGLHRTKNMVTSHTSLCVGGNRSAQRIICVCVSAVSIGFSVEHRSFCATSCCAAPEDECIVIL